MSEGLSTTDESAENQETGSSDGSTAGTQTAGADTFASERDALEARVRSFQGEADRAKARSAELERQLAQATATPSVREDGSFDPEAFASRLYTDFERKNELAQAAIQLRTEFDLADPVYFGKEYRDQFDSAESLRAAVEADHKRVQSLVDARAAAKEEALRAEMSERYGIALDSPAGGEGNTPAGDPSVTDFARLSFAEQNRLEAENPGITDRILRNAMSTS